MGILLAGREKCSKNVRASLLPSTQAQQAQELHALVGLEAEKIGWPGARLQRNPREQSSTIAIES